MKAFIRHFGGVSLLATAAQATSRNCRDINVPVTISSENLALPFPPPQSDIEVTNFILANVQMDPSSPLPPPQFINISGTFDLMTTYCEPESGPSKALQILTHGIGFDRSYWDFDYNQHNYSYVNFALDHGYSTLSWDRLGLGMSSHLDPIKQMQTPLEVAALAKLSSMAWDGLLPEIESSFEKIIHVGHSYGSSITYSLSVTSPQLTDGVVLTGFTHARDTAGLAPIALHLVDAQSRSEYAHGYTLQGDKTAVHTIFFSPGNFDSAVLDAVYEASQPLALGELATFDLATTDKSKMEGPALVIVGEHDLVFCGGNCYDVGDNTGINSVAELSKDQFPHSRAFKALTLDGAGHGLNLEYSWPTTYSSIIDFLVQNGLDP